MRKSKEYELAYFGVWRMEDDCLHLEISDGEGGYMEGRFPVLIDPSGENLHIQQDSGNGRGPSFLRRGYELYGFDARLWLRNKTETEKSGRRFSMGIFDKLKRVGNQVPS